MITTIADLLRGIMTKEAEILDEQELYHGPTIGEMYEGLTRDILDRAIPTELNIRVVDGFIKGVDGKNSPQIDAMIVTGHGQPVPYTNKFIWPIQDVIAAFEVKKTLYGSDLKDAFTKLRTVKSMYGKYLQSGVTTNVDTSFRAFAHLTGSYPDTIECVNKLPEELSHLFHTILTEQIAPTTVILGFHGYVDESGLRDGLIEYLKNEAGSAMGFNASPVSMPNLIIARSNSLLKMDGHPYITKLNADWWRLIVSNSENPLRILIEILWNKLGMRFGSMFPVDDNLQMEKLVPFLDTRFVKKDGCVGWEYKHIALTKSQIADTQPPTWNPEAAKTCEMVVQLRIAKEGKLDTLEEEFRTFVLNEGLDPDDLIARMVERRMLAWIDNHTVRLIDSDFLLAGFLPNGDGFTTADPDMLSLWLNQELDKR